MLITVTNMKHKFRKTECNMKVPYIRSVLCGPAAFVNAEFALKNKLMTRLFYIGFIVLVFAMTTTHSFARNNTGSTPLAKIHQKIIKDIPDMSHISRADLATQLGSNEILLLDTRPAKEYNISHISGALQVDPNISPKMFHIRFGEALKNKKVIVYCSVGRRSSILGSKLQSTALSAGATSIQNMEGGLFGWHNDNRPLVNASGNTSGIHPYNVFWGRLIENKDDIRYRP